MVVIKFMNEIGFFLFINLLLFKIGIYVEVG